MPFDASIVEPCVARVISASADALEVEPSFRFEL